MAPYFLTKNKSAPTPWPLGRPAHRSVHLWLIPPWSLRSFSDVAGFSLDEKERAGETRSAASRKAAWRAQKQAVVRYLLASYSQREPASLCFRHAPHGKPCLMDGDGLEFNVSHSRGYVVLALAQDMPVGVDIEYIRSRPRDELAVRILGSAAAEEYGRLDDHARSSAFSFAWSEREALGKMSGFGVCNEWSHVLSVFSSHNLLTPPRFGAARLVNGHALYYLNALPSYSLVLCAAGTIASIKLHYVEVSFSAPRIESVTLSAFEFHSIAPDAIAPADACMPES